VEGIGQVFVSLLRTYKQNLSIRSIVFLLIVTWPAENCVSDTGPVIGGLSEYSNTSNIEFISSARGNQYDLGNEITDGGPLKANMSI
jgi:hypothetical protein